MYYYALPSAARIFGIHLELRDPLVCIRLNPRDFQTYGYVNVRISITLYPATATY